MFEKSFRKKVNQYIKDESNQANLNHSLVTTSNIKAILGNSNDIVVRDFFINGHKSYPTTLFFIDGLVNQDKISDFILKPLCNSDSLKKAKNEKDLIDQIIHGSIYYPTIKLINQMDQVINAIMTGHAVLVFDSPNIAIAFETKGYEKRSISPSAEESSFKGSKLSFVEDLRVNTATLRLQIKSPNLTIEGMLIGKQTQTPVSLIYMRNICKQDFISQVKKRLASINQDSATFLTDISDYLVDNKYTLFPQIQYTEKPDAVSASLLEGKVAVIVDGLPYAMVMPIVINDMMQAPSDYGLNYIVASLFRMIRWGLLFIALILPGFYIALTEYHNSMIPKALAFAIAASTVDTPFSITLEVLIMLFTFFTLIEASIRIPVAIGSTVSIVGGLVLGDAAITAKLVSPGVIVVVATSAIASMAVPNKDMNFAVWICLLLNALLSSSLGLFGLMIGFLIILYHLSTLEIMGVPFLAPFAGAKKLQLEDSIIRFPEFLLKFRPYHLNPKNKRRRW
jgi:spore germination protein KA